MSKINMTKDPQKRINKWIAFIKKETKADVSKLGIVDIEHLCRHCLSSLALDFPNVAKDIAKEIECPFE